MAEEAASCSQWCKMRECGKQQLLELIEMWPAGNHVTKKVVEVYGKFKIINKTDEGKTQDFSGI